MIQAYTKEFSYNWRLASPVILGMLGHTFVGFIDSVMVGQLGTAELAAVSLGNSFVFIAMSFGIGFSTAITPLVAEADFEKNHAGLKSAFKHGLFWCVLMGFCLWLLVLLAKPLLYVLDQPEEVVYLSIPYLNLVAFSLVPLIIFQAFKQLSDGLSLTKYPMYATLFANLINVAINYVLIFGKFGFPKMGLVGAAVGTLVSRFLMLFVLLVLLGYAPKAKKYLKNLKFWILDRMVMKKVFSLGFPSALQMFFEVGIFTSAIWLSGFLGKNHQAANQIALNLSSMTFMIAMGLGVAAMIRVGNQKGLRAFKELRRIAQSVFFLGFIFAIFFGFIFFIFNNELPKLYFDLEDLHNLSDNKQVISIAAQLLLIAAFYQISDTAQVIFLGALRGLQDVKIPTLITFVSYWIVGFPFSYFLGREEFLGSIGIWIGLLLGLTTASIFLYLRFNYLTKLLMVKQTKIINTP